MAVRAVPDTNVVVAAHHAIQPGSPNAKIIDRWEGGEFTLLYSPDVLLEYAKKLIETGAPGALAARFIARMVHRGAAGRIEFFHLRHYPVDADDIDFLFCALNGDAAHLVTYDPHLLDLQPHYPLMICEPLTFLSALCARGLWTSGSFF